MPDIAPDDIAPDIASDPAPAERMDDRRPEPSRRHLLGGLVAMPGLVLAAAAGRGLGSAAGALRPAGRGSSAGRCGQCGARDHHMLAAACPAAPAVR